MSGSAGNPRRVYVTRMLDKAVMNELARFADYDVNQEPRLLTRQELLENVRGREAVLCMLGDRIDAEVFDAAGPQCRIFANYAVGYNNIDVDEAARRGIMITNTPDVLTDATADLAWTLLFAAARRVAEGDRLMRSSTFTWAPDFMLGMDVTGSTLGIIGHGRIGTNFARKARAFDMRILYAGRRRSPEFEAETGGEFVPMDTLLSEADFLSLHVPLTPDTRHMIGEAELAKMKPTAVLVNTSRGPVVDEAALADALKNRVIWAAGLDVYENEPDVHPTLRALDNVVLLPHIGSATMKTRRNMGLVAVRNIAAVLEGNEPPNAVKIS